MKKFKEYWVIIIFLITLLSLYFYWFEWRKYQATVYCSKKVYEWIDEKKPNSSSAVQTSIDLCLIKKGVIR